MHVRVRHPVTRLASITHSLTHSLQELLFNGDFDMAKTRAQQEGKWVMLNLQSNSEFDSHR